MHLSKRNRSLIAIDRETDRHNTGQPWTYRHLIVLSVLCDNPEGLTSRDVGDILNCNYKNTNRLMEKLETHYGFVERVPLEGRRGFIVQPTRKGHETIKRIFSDE